VFELRCEWGEAGARLLAASSDVVVIVDVLSFSTCVDVAVSRGAEILPHPPGSADLREFAERQGAEAAGARGGARFSLSPSTFLDVSAGTRVVLPSPNGALASLASTAPVLLAGCLRNAKAVARAAADEGPRISVIPAGERWPGGELRPCLEDWIAAGCILSFLDGRPSPEVRAAVAGFQQIEGSLQRTLEECMSGQELRERGYPEDVKLAGMLNASDAVPYFDGTAYRRTRTRRTKT
jgi:2-phosphosulfolactate phosphatase